MTGGPLPSVIEDQSQLNHLLSQPTEAAIQAMQRLDGDIMLLGVGGKMGPTLARMAGSATEAAGVTRRIIGVSRFSSPDAQHVLETHSVETIRGDLLDESFLADLPDAANIIFMAGMKFGATEQASKTWAMNVHLPTLICRRFPKSRILAFSTGNVYPLVPIESGGSRESDSVGPVGEYAMTALGRERMFDYFCRKMSIPTTLFRLNYATELRYGVLVDIAQQVWNDAPVDLTMGYANVIWQRDANAMALAALADADIGPFIVNCAGPELVGVRETANTFGNLFGKTPRFVGEEQPTALLSNGTKGHGLYGDPTIPLPTLINWVSHWVRSGNPTLNKPTHFQTRDGRF